MSKRITRGWEAPFAGTYIWLSGLLRRTLCFSVMEKRKCPRVPLSIRVTRMQTGSFSYYHAHNISAGGMFIKSMEPVPAGAELTLRFSLFPDRNEIEVQAVVVWSRGPGGPGVPGMGVKFTRADPESRRLIETFVEMKI